MKRALKLLAVSTMLLFGPGPTLHAASYNIPFLQKKASRIPSVPAAYQVKATLQPPSSQTAFICPTPPHPLDCWLNNHPNIANNIRWQMHPGSINLKWADWDEPRKAQLRKAFDDYTQWWGNGMTYFPGTEFPDPPPNGIVLQDTEPALLGMSEQTAWAVYLSYVAVSLAAETHHWFPWSILGYEDEDLYKFFTSTQMFNYDSYHLYHPTFVGYFETDITPAPPTVVYQFLKANGILQPTVLDTVGNMVGWLKNGAHMYGNLGNSLNAQYHWAYRGPPPVSRILAGTVITDPQFSDDFPYPMHWIHACYGSTDFLKFMLRAINIPVRRIQVCNHVTPYFPTIDRYLSHGDDPYSSAGKSPPAFPGKDFLITGTKFEDWFHGQTQWDDIPECLNVGRQPKEIALQNLADYLVDKYCQDVSQNKSHADGSVMAVYDDWYTVAELEAMNLWNNLSAKAQAQGKCQ